MADPRYAGTIFGDMQDKDPELFATLETMHPGDAVDVWCKKYPDDLPERGMTMLGERYRRDGTPLIKPKQ